MHLRDYIAVGSCKICGRPIYSPTVWNGEGDIPRHRTCNCSVKSQINVSGKLLSPEDISPEIINPE